MWQLVKLRTDSIYLLYVCFNLRTIAVALVVVYSTDSSSRSIGIEAGRLLSMSRSYRAMGYGRQNLGLGLHAKREHRSVKCVAPRALLFYIDLMLIT